MTDVQQAQADLGFIREAVNRRGKPHFPGENIYLIWAVYTLIGYTLIDLWPHASGMFFLIGGFVAGVISGIVSRRLRARVGEFDAEEHKRQALHWVGGALLIGVACIVMQTLYPVTRNVIGGQICVELFGLLYFAAGVHFDRHFLWLGPVLMAGGLAVGYMPVLPWTSLGIVLSLGLCVPYLSRRWRHG